MCPLCSRVTATQEGSYPFLVKEFKNSYLYLGEHQFYEGYCVLVSKHHYCEMSDIPSPAREELFAEMMLASDAIIQVFHPKKMNLSSYGNVVEHLHWHLFPRYEGDPQFLNPPWLQMNEFDNKKPTPDQRDQLIQRLQAQLS